MRRIPPALWLGLAALALLLPGLGSESSPTHFMEYAYSVPIPLEMRESGEWMTPLLEGEPHLLKPPLLWWLILLAYKALGISLTAMRLPAALSIAATAAATVPLAAALGLAPAAALAAGCLTLGSYSVFLQGKLSLIDAPLTLAMVLALWGLARALLRGDPRGLYLCGAAGGLSMMLKWPVAPAVIGLTLGLLAVWERRLPGRGLGRHWLGAAAVVAAVVVPWNAWMARVHGPDYWRVVFLGEMFSVRFVTSTNVPWWRFALMCLGGMLPWTPLLLATLRPGARPLTRAERLIWAWTAASLIPFLVQKTKTERYVLFIVPALAAWTAARFDPARAAHRLGARVGAITAALVGACALAFVLWMRGPLAAGLLAAAAAAAAARSLWRGRSLAAAGLASAAMLAALLGGIVPAVGSGALPPTEALAAMGPVDTFPLAKRLAHLPVRQKHSSWQCRELGCAALAAERGRPVAACGGDAEGLESLWGALGYEPRELHAWSQTRVDRRGLSEWAAALGARSLAPLGVPCRILRATPARPGPAAPTGPHVRPGKYLALLQVHAGDGAGRAGGYRPMGIATLRAGSTTIIKAPFHKREFLRADPYRHVWPIRLDAAVPLGAAADPFPGEPAAAVAGLRVAPLGEAAFARLSAWAERP